MTKTDKPNDNETAYAYGPRKDLTIQDAFIMMAVYAAQIDPEHSRGDIKCIEEFAQKHPLFIEINARSGDIISRINLFANHLSETEPMKVVEKATDNLNPKQRKEAFQFATEVASMCKVAPEVKMTALRMLATKLGLGKEFIKTVIC